MTGQFSSAVGIGQLCYIDKLQSIMLLNLQIILSGNSF